MVNGFRKLYRESTLADKIRFSYLILLLPVLIFIVVTYTQLRSVNRRYDTMVDSAVAASQFSLDFKKDFDYETYLLIVGNKKKEDSRLTDMLDEAQGVISSLESLTTSAQSGRRLESAKKYIKNLSTYTERIYANLDRDNTYEENINIWESDVQIVTQLLQDTVSEYIYYEVRQLQEEKVRYRQIFVATAEISGISLVGILILISILSYYIPRSITRPVRELRDVTLRVAQGDLSVRAHISAGRELTELGASMNAMIEELSDLLDKVRQEQGRLRKAEFELLQAQINPHFLYNTLDAIIWLAEAGERARVISMVSNLSEFFRTSLSKGRDIISLREEIQHVRSYLEIQQVRYRDILRYEINVPEEYYTVTIPKITIQPLAENAIYHGIKNRRGGGSIRIAAYAEDGDLIISVSDDGAGMTSERLSQVRASLSGMGGASDSSRYESGCDNSNSPYGLYNVNERIRLNYGDDYGLFIDSNLEEGTVVLVRVPLNFNLYS